MSSLLLLAANHDGLSLFVVVFSRQTKKWQKIWTRKKNPKAKRKRSAWITVLCAYLHKFWINIIFLFEIYESFRCDGAEPKEADFNNSQMLCVCVIFFRGSQFFLSFLNLCFFILSWQHLQSLRLLRDCWVVFIAKWKPQIFKLTFWYMDNAVSSLDEFETKIYINRIHFEMQDKKPYRRIL